MKSNIRLDYGTGLISSG